MTFNVPAPRDEIVASDVAPIAGYLNGNAGTTYEHIAKRAGNSTTLYADTIVQRDTTNGLIFRAGYGASGSETWIIDATKTRTLISGFSDKGGYGHNILAYGAVRDASIQGGVWTGTDNTAAIQAAINAAAGGSTSRIVYIPDGVWLCGQLDLTNLSNSVTIVAAAGASTRLVPTTAVNGKVWIDCTGSGSFQMYNLGLGDTANPGTPNVGMLFANSNTSGNASNVHYLEGVRMSGPYSVAALYGIQLNSSRFNNCGFANSYTSGAAAAMYLSAQNKASVSSDFTTISTTYAGCTDLSFVGCEFHGDTGSSTTNYAIRLENVNGVSFLRGPNSASTTTAAIVRIDTDQVGGTQFGNSFISFRNCGLSTETGTPVSSYAIYISNPDGDGYVEALTIEETASTADSSLIRAEGGTTLKKLRISGHHMYGSGTNLITPVSGNLTLEDVDIDCSGLAVNTGSGTITRGIIRNPGTITVSTNSALVLDSGGSVLARSGVLGLGGAIASDGSIRAAAITSWRIRNNANNGDHIVYSTDASDNVTLAGLSDSKNMGTLTFGTTGGNIGAVTMLAPTGTLGAVVLGKTSGSSTVTINSTSGVSLTYGATTRFATTNTGGTLTGILAATTALTAGATPATTGGVRLTNNSGIYARNSTNASNVPLANLDASDNLQVGDTTTVSVATVAGANGVQLSTVNGYVQIGTSAPATTATTGFPSVPAMAGTPTGAASPATGYVLGPIVDTTNNRLYVRYGGNWKYAALT